MKSLSTKKIIIVFGVVLAISVGMIVLGLAFGNTKIPQVENPNEIVYEQVDENGDVIYTITKQELYEQMKTNNGVNQVIALLDEVFLADYLDLVTQEEIDAKIQYLTYQTNDPDVIADYDAETLANFEENFSRSMILSGYHDGEEESYAQLVVAREKFVVDQIIESGDITEEAVAEYYINDYFEDIEAIRLRFLNKGDAVNVLEHFNLAEVDDALTLYLGYIYLDEDLTYDHDADEDTDEIIIEAQITVDTYFEDVNGHIVDTEGDIAYTKANETYLDDDDNVFTMDTNGNIVDDETNIVVDNSMIFATLEEAETYKNNNTTYYTVELNGDVIEIYDSSDVLVYTIDEDGIIYDITDTDVTDSVDLRINKEFTDIEDVTIFTENNTSELTDDDVLMYYIKMYNYIYGEYRDTLDENATVTDLIALDNSYFDFNYDTVKDQSEALATYMFSTVSALNETLYTADPYNVGDYTYMVYKLSEGTKIDLKTMVMDVIEDAIIVPVTATTDIELITEGPYESTISWTSSNPEVISNEGVVTTPEEDSIVSLSYTINALGTTKTGVKIIQVPMTGDNSEIGTFDETSYVTLKTMLNDDTLFAEIEDLILNDMVYGDSGSTNISKYLTEARSEANIEFYDYFMSLDYIIDFDSAYDKSNRGSSSTLASIELEDGTTFKLTAEDFYQYSLERNPSLMIFYAAQYKEALYSDYYTVLFGTQRDIQKNDSEYMGYLDNYITSIQNEYNSYLSSPYFSLYEQYYGWNFDTFQTYLYSRYRVEDVITLKENLVLSELRMLFIQETLEDTDVVDIIYDNVQENYNNFFSLYAQQILVYFDFDEDGELDDYIEYYDSLSAEDQTAFDALVSRLETLINESEESFADIVSLYEGMSREDEDWGAFKQHGFILKYESLNPKDDNETEQAITYSGEYGVKDTYIEEFTEALIDIYAEYQNPLNVNLDSMISDLVPTKFGLHLIEVEKGDDFDGISLMIEADDYDSISDELLNANDMPSLDQVDAYFTYKLYDEFNDLENVSMMNKYGVTLPIIPDEVITELDFYASDTLDNLFGSSMVNYAFIARISDGNILSNITQAEFDENMQALLDIYYDVTIGDIIVE